MDGSAMSVKAIIAREVSAGCNTVDWERGRSDSEDVADAILSALRSAGFAVVPVEPTEGMAMAFHEAQWRAPQDRTYMRRLEDFADRYKAMLKAAQEDSRE
jgi:hypothetical protein